MTLSKRLQETKEIDAAQSKSNCKQKVRNKTFNREWAGSTGVNPTRNSTQRLEKHALEETRPRSVRQTLKKPRRQRRFRHKPSDRNEKTFSGDENRDRDKTMTILQLGPASMLRLTVKVNSNDIVAVIDTGTEVNIISDKV